MRAKKPTKTPKIMSREQKITDAFGSTYYRKVRKSEGYYQNIKTGEIQYLLNPCKGWRKLK